MIRAYQPADCEAVLEVWARASVLAHPFLGREFLARERRDLPRVHLPAAETWVWEADGRVVGFISLLGNEVGAIFVDPDVHRTGIGRALLDKARALRGDLEVEVFEKNHLGRSFYAGMGFRLLRRETHQETGFEILRLRLAAGDPRRPDGATGRRQVLRSLGALGVSAAVAGPSRLTPARPRGYDVLIVGAGVFGVWCASRLHAAGKRVAVIDSVGPAHSRASSGGESRAIRCGYGPKSIYSQWAWSSINDWQALSARTGLPIFHPVGVLWIHKQADPLVQVSASILSRQQIPHTLLSAQEMRSRYPVMHVADDEAGFLEPRAGALMARRAVQALAAELRSAGVTFLTGKVAPVRRQQGEGGALPAVATAGGEKIEAGQFVFACGPWLDQVCPEAMAGRLFVTRQEVFYFAVGGGAAGDLPVWADLPFYGFPSLEERGFKVASDTHGSPMSPDTGDRRASARGERAARRFLARRFPRLADAPLSETRVCQYENSSDGHLLIDRHPGLENVWLVGCGSGHGFKHGPAVGGHVADLLAGRARPREPFLLAGKQGPQKRDVQ